MDFVFRRAISKKKLRQFVSGVSGVSGGTPETPETNYRNFFLLMQNCSNFRLFPSGRARKSCIQDGIIFFSLHDWLKKHVCIVHYLQFYAVLIPEDTDGQLVQSLTVACAAFHFSHVSCRVLKETEPSRLAAKIVNVEQSNSRNSCSRSDKVRS